MAHYSVSLKSSDAISNLAQHELYRAAYAVAEKHGLLLQCALVEPAFTVKISQDVNPLNPRTNQDNAGVMWCAHPCYNLGDKGAEDPVHPNYIPDSDGPVFREGIALCMPIYLYDHSGITISHGAFSCQWDSGHVGWHYLTRAALLSDFNGDIEAAKKCLEAELEEYDHYLRGNVWHVSIDDEEGDVIESCGGFIGDDIEACGIIGNFDEKYNDALRTAWERRFG